MLYDHILKTKTGIGGIIKFLQCSLCCKQKKKAMGIVIKCFIKVKLMIHVFKGI